MAHCSGRDLARLKLKVASAPHAQDVAINFGWEFNYVVKIRLPFFASGPVSFRFGPLCWNASQVKSAPDSHCLFKASSHLRRPFIQSSLMRPHTDRLMSPYYSPSLKWGSRVNHWAGVGVGEGGRGSTRPSLELIGGL